MTGTNFNAFTLSGVTLLLVLTLAPAVAQETEFNIEAQPLAKALLEFNEQSGLTVAARRDLVADKTAPAVHGEMEPEVALGRILTGTGLKLTQLSSGGYTITVDAADLGKYRSGRSPVPMARNQIVAAQSQTAASRTEATRSGRSDERGAGIVTGKVTDARTGANLKGALVTIEETGQTTSTNDLGEFRFANVPSGSATLTVSYLGYAGQSAVVRVRGDGTSQDFALRGGSEIEEIVVFGQRSARALALNQERTADNVSTIVSSDLIGNFPGTTISEALKRAPGVAFERDSLTGDGVNVIVRGLEPDLNAVTLNGLRLPEGSGEGRSANLNNILADSVSKVTISKSLLPSQDSFGTGGLIDIETKSPLDRPKSFATIRVETGRSRANFLDDTFLSGTLSRTLGDTENLGLSASVQYRDRALETYSYDMEFLFGPYLPVVESEEPILSLTDVDPNLIFPFEDGVDLAYPRNLWNRFSRVSTKNKSATVSAAWEPSSNVSLRADYLRAEDTTSSYVRSQSLSALMGYVPLSLEELSGETRGVLVWEDSFAGVADPGLYLSIGQDFDGTTRETTTDSVSISGNVDSGAWEHEISLGYTKGKEEAPSQERIQLQRPFAEAIDPGLLTQEALQNTVNGQIVSLYRPRRGNSYPLPRLNSAGFAFFNDSDNYTLSSAAIQAIRGENRRGTVKFDTKWNVDKGPLKYVGAGVFFESAKFESDDGFPLEVFGSGASLSNLGLRFSDDSLSAIGINGGLRVVSEDSVRSFFRNIDQLAQPNPDLTVARNEQPFSRVGAFTEEENLAGYLQAGLQFGSLDLVGGWRFDTIDIVARNPQSPILFDEFFVRDVEFEEEFSVLVDQKASQTKALPRLLANYRWSDNAILRIGYFRTVARPRIEQLSSDKSLALILAPFFGPNNNQPVLSVTEGNPNLSPSETDNYDLSMEFYFRDIGAAKIGLFYKEIDNLLSQNVSVGFDVIDGVELPDDPRFLNLPDNILITGSRPENSDFAARLWGIETSIETQFSKLPGLWAGLGIFLNYTYTDSSKTEEVFITDSSGVSNRSLFPDTRFTQDPKHSGTAALTYNFANIDATLAYSRQDSRLLDFDVHGLSTYADSYETLDLRIEYRLDAGRGEYQFYLEGADLLRGTDDADVERFVGGAGITPRYSSGGTFYGGRSVRIGLAATL